MREITSGFTGDAAVDMKYLQEKCEEYKEHEMAQEILRACGRLMYEMIPDDKKAEMSKALNKDCVGTDAALEEIRFNIYEKNYDKALKMIEGLVKKVEELNMFQDDQVSEYHLFDEFFEEILYRHIYNPTKDLRRPEMIPYTEIYMLYGSLLMELNRLDEAREALQKGLRWSPLNFQIMSEYIETFKMEGDMDKFFEKTVEAFKIAIHAPAVARCFRNLGYYFVEKKLYSEAIAAYLLSTRFEKDSKQVQSELYYINQVAGGIKEPSYEVVEAYSEKYGFPTGANGDILGLAYTYGKHFMEDGQNEAARYCIGILYELTQDEDVKKMLDSIPADEE